MRNAADPKDGHPSFNSYYLPTELKPGMKPKFKKTEQFTLSAHAS